MFPIVQPSVNCSTLNNVVSAMYMPGGTLTQVPVFSMQQTVMPVLVQQPLLLPGTIVPLGLPLQSGSTVLLPPVNPVVLSQGTLNTPIPVLQSEGPSQQIIPVLGTSSSVFQLPSNCGHLNVPASMPPGQCLKVVGLIEGNNTFTSGVPSMQNSLLAGIATSDINVPTDDPFNATKRVVGSVPCENQTQVLQCLKPTEISPTDICRTSHLCSKRLVELKCKSRLPVVQHTKSAGPVGSEAEFQVCPGPNYAPCSQELSTNVATMALFVKKEMGTGQLSEVQQLQIPKTEVSNSNILPQRLVVKTEPGLEQEDVKRGIAEYSSPVVDHQSISRKTGSKYTNCSPNREGTTDHCMESKMQEISSKYVPIQSASVTSPCTDDQHSVKKCFAERPRRCTRAEAAFIKKPPVQRQRSCVEMQNGAAEKRPVGRPRKYVQRSRLVTESTVIMNPVSVAGRGHSLGQPNVSVQIESAPVKEAKFIGDKKQHSGKTEKWIPLQHARNAEPIANLNSVCSGIQNRPAKRPNESAKYSFPVHLLSVPPNCSSQTEEHKSDRHTAVTELSQRETPQISPNRGEIKCIPYSRMVQKKTKFQNESNVQPFRFPHTDRPLDIRIESVYSLNKNWCRLGETVPNCPDNSAHADQLSKFKPSFVVLKRINLTKKVLGGMPVSARRMEPRFKCAWKCRRKAIMDMCKTSKIRRVIFQR